MKPLVKWAGGKTRLLDELHALMPRSYTRYYEPMCGGAALFWSLPDLQSPLLSDANADLINLYQWVARSPAQLCMLLQHYQRSQSEAFYYRVRDSWNADSLTDTARAAMFTYLNKACYNGLWRVNKSGQFNVPYGKNDNATIYETEHVLAASKLLQGAEVVCGDYLQHRYDRGGFVYFDPPYDRVAADSFTAYTTDEFDHERLAAHATLLVDRGVQVMLSHSDTPRIRALYHAPWKLHQVQCARSINSDGAKRGKVPELIITGGY